MQEEDQLQINPVDYIVYVCGDITTPMAIMVTQQLLALEMQNTMIGVQHPIQMIINSPGGEVSAAWQIIEVMDYIDTPVLTTALGQIASAALMIFMNGEPGTRQITKRTSIMSHRYSSGIAGSHQDLISIGSEFHNAFKRILSHYSECTGLDEKTIKEELLCEHDVWLTPAKAKKYNIADIISDTKKDKILRYQKKQKKTAKKVTNGRSRKPKPTE
jgi:ATP-dependent Clp protease protease subunit